MRLYGRGIPSLDDNGQHDTDVDRYPSLDYCFARVLDAIGDDIETVERIEVSALASGECTYRVWPARAEEPEQGYFPPPDAS